MVSEEYKAIQERLDHIEWLQQMAVKPVIDIKEAAAFTGFTVPYLYRLTSKREIPFYKKNRKVLFKKSDLVDWLCEVRIMTESELESRAATYCATR